MRSTRLLAAWCGLWYLCLCALVLPYVPTAGPPVVASAYVPPAVILEPPTELPVAVLRRAATLVSSQIGPGGSLSAEGIAWRELAFGRAAEPDFERLLRTGSVAGQLYALAWLYRADPVLFRIHADRLRALDTRLDVLQGCILRSAVPVRDLVGEISRGDWTQDLEAPAGRTLRSLPPNPRMQPTGRSGAALPAGGTLRERAVERRFARALA